MFIFIYSIYQPTNVTVYLSICLSVHCYVGISRVPDQADQSGQRVDCHTISTSSFVAPMCQPAIGEVSRALTQLT